MITRVRILFLLLATVAAFTPFRVPAGGVDAEMGAMCTTCCSGGGMKCVVCSATCTVVDEAYDSGGGKCPKQTT
jgi:hypothetical protein